jgi:tRNA (guanine-N7-)-methyltransferase
LKIDSEKYPLPNRMRHHTSPNLYLPLSELKEVPNFYPPLIESIDWKDVYSNSLPPSRLDVGCGKGRLLLDTAEAYPEINILGIEVRKGAVDWLQEVIAGENIPNCGILWYSVVNGLGFINSESIDEIYYLFPDPWPKKKHHKRRAFNNPVLLEFIRVLRQGGRLFLATDVEEVHEYHLEMLKDIKSLNPKFIESDDEWGLPITNKETFCRKMNIPFYRIIATKE